MIQFVRNLCTFKVVQYQSKFGRCQGDLLFSLDSSKEHQADLVKRVGALLLVETKSDLMPGTCLDTCRQVAQLSLPDIPYVQFKTKNRSWRNILSHQRTSEFSV